MRGLRQRPETLMDAFKLAAGWKINVPTSNGLTSTAFATTFLQKPTKNDQTTPSSNPTLNRQTADDGDKQGETSGS